MATETITLRKGTYQLFYLAVVITLLLLLMYLYKLHQLGRIQPRNANIPTVIASHVYVTQFDPQGHLLYQFSTPQLWHYDQEHRTDFTQPIGLYYSAKQEPWTLTADRGQAFQGDDIIVLTGNVRLVQPAGSHNTATTLTTSSVTLYPSKNIAENNLPTEMERPDVSLSSVGFKADLNRNQLVLLSQAQAQFRPVK